MTKHLSTFRSWLHCWLMLSLVLGLCGCSRTTRRDRHLARGQNFFKAEQYDKAEIEFLNALRIDNTNAVALRQLGLSYYQQGRLLQAYAFLQRAAEVNPHDIEARLRVGGILVASRKLKEARAHAEAVLARDPANEEALMLLADTPNSRVDLAALDQRLESFRPNAQSKAGFHLARGTLNLRQARTNEALADFQRALAINPNSSPVHLALGNIYSFLKDNSKAEFHFKTAADLAPVRSARRLQYADFKLRTGDIPAAKAFLDSMVRQAPDYLPAHSRRAEIAMAERKFDEAAALAKKILTRDPGNYDALLLLGRLSMARGEPAAALSHFERFVTAYPGVPQAHHQLALAHLMNKNQPRAVSSLQQAILLDPQHIESVLLLAELNIRKGDLFAAIAALRRLLQDQPQIARAHLLLATAYRAQPDFPAAIATYENMARIFPRNPQPHFLWGQVLLQQGKKNDARAKLEEAAALAPDFLPAVDELVDLDIEEKRFAAAEQRVQKHLEAQPKSPGLLVSLARIYSAQQDHARAEDALSRAIALDPDYQPAYLALARAYVASKRQQSALDKLNALLAKSPNDIGALMLIGMLHNELKNYNAARDAYERLLAINPRFVPALNNLAYIYSERLNQLDKAYKIARTARDLRPFDPHVADTLAWIVFKRGEYPWALGLLQESADSLPKDPEVSFHLGMTHYMLGEEQPARLAFQRALDSGQDFPGKAEAQQRLAFLTAPESKDVQAVERQLAANPRDPILLARLAGFHEQSGSFEKAAAAYQQAIQQNPRNILAMIKLAQLYAGPLRNPSKAMQIAREANALSPEDPHVRHTLGRLALQAGEYQWSLSLLQESAQRLPNQPDLLRDLAWSFLFTGHITEAQSTMKRFLDTNPGAAAEAKRFLEMTAVILGPTNAPSNAPRITAILQEDPAYVPALLASAIAQEQAGHTSAARDQYLDVLKKVPSLALAHKRLAILLHRSPPDRPAAYDHALKARAAFPDDPEVARALGILCFQRQEYPRATQLLKEASRKLPSDAESFFYLGMAHYHSRRSPDAAEALRYALAQAPDAPFAPEARRVLSQIK